MSSDRPIFDPVKRRVELLAPGGDVDSIKAAIIAGADAIYCGLKRFNARNRAENISFDELQGILRLAHKNSCRVFLTLNILIVESEIPAIIKLLNQLVNTSIDGIIVQDLGMLYLLSTHFKSIKIHASTQLTTHNEGHVKFLVRLNVSRVNLSRELSLHEIKALIKVAQQHAVLSEVFVHGSYCISFSGICYMSSVIGGKSGNRGSCSQPCRDRYVQTGQGNEYPLNLKDNSAYFDLNDLYEAGVDSLKIEGRIKGYEYVYSVVNSWKKLIQSFYDGSPIENNSDLFKVFNRDFSNGFLKGDIHKEMFIDHPMSQSTLQHAENQNEQKALFTEKEEIRIQIKNKIESLKIEKAPISIYIAGKAGSPLTLSIKTPETSFELSSSIALAEKGMEMINHQMLLKSLKRMNHTEYYIEHLDTHHLAPNLYIPFKEITSIKRRLWFMLNGSKEYIKPIPIPFQELQPPVKIKPGLSVLISSIKDLSICNNSAAKIYFQIPGGFKNEYEKYIDLFTNNTQLIPWFPSILIGEDYEAAVRFLQALKPEEIVANNTGIGYEAYKLEIPWTAGPCLNLSNSFSLLSLKENFRCSGAFISNELNEFQIKSIKRPRDFELNYCIYQPILLMTSRQCLFHQVTGCKKDSIDDSCITSCQKSASVTNLNNQSFLIEKTPGNYHKIYHENSYLNTSIVQDIPNFFSHFLIDLRIIKTKTHIDLDKPGLIKLFEDLLTGNVNSINKLEQVIHPATNTQYVKGI